jgi:hypothetical protein
VLSDHEQRALDELERSFATEAREPAPPGGRRLARTAGPPGVRTTAVLGGVSVLLLFAGVAVAALALAAATALGWLFWRLCVRGASGDLVAAPRARAPQGGTERRFGESVRDYLTWLAEAE